MLFSSIDLSVLTPLLLVVYFPSGRLATSFFCFHNFIIGYSYKIIFINRLYVSLLYYGEKRLLVYILRVNRSYKLIQVKRLPLCFHLSYSRTRTQYILPSTFFSLRNVLKLSSNRFCTFSFKFINPDKHIHRCAHIYRFLNLYLLI